MANEGIFVCVVVKAFTFPCLIIRMRGSGFERRERLLEMIFEGVFGIISGSVAGNCCVAICEAFHGRATGFGSTKGYRESKVILAEIWTAILGRGGMFFLESCEICHNSVACH